MDKLTIDSLTVRVEQLERKNRRLTRFGTAALVCCIAVWSFGADRAEVVEGERFVLRAPDGAVRATIEVDAHRMARLTMLGGGHKGSASLYAHPNGASGLQLTDREGKIRLWANLQPPDGNPEIDLRDEAGEPRVTAEVMPGGVNFVRLDGRDGKSGIILLNPDDPAPMLRIFGKDGNPVLEIPKP